jgi:hypothetical protein
MSDQGDYYAHPPVHYVNDHRQAMLTMALLSFAAILSVAMILWALLV